MTGALVAQNVWRDFIRREKAVVALQDISMDVAEAEFVSIVGPSGCGKSTFLNIVAGFLTPSRGSVSLDGVPVTGPGADRGMVFQENALFPWMTVYRNVEYGLRIQKVPKAQRKERVAHFLDLISLKNFEHFYPKELSGGMKQRVAIARALVYRPKILLMDEPFAALDAQTRRFLQDELVRIWSETNPTILFITHNIDEAILISDRVFVMTSRPGRIKQCIKLDLDRPRSETDYKFIDYKVAIIDLLKDEVEHALRQSGELAEQAPTDRPVDGEYQWEAKQDA
jgi:NitT/TauT family transport system ATP-binding protein